MWVYEALTRAAAELPDKVAVIGCDRQYTYREAEEASNQVARFLMDHGINRGERIGIFSPKCLEEVPLLFGAMKAGAVFVHLNPHFKEEQLTHIIRDCGIRLLFLHESKQRIWAKSGMLTESDCQVVTFGAGAVHGELGFHPEAYSVLPPAIDCTGDGSEPAALIYTSGSTGRPKGIIVTHRIFKDATEISARLLENTREDRIISVSPFSFDGALSQLFTAVYVGATLVLQESLFPKDIVKTLLEQRITGFHAVPSFWRMLMQRHSPFIKQRYNELRYVTIIGESFPAKELAELKQVLPDTKFYMMYGTTEAFRSTCLLPEESADRPGSVGKPLPGVTIRVVNEAGQDCGPEEEGEIVHEGVFISPGYWNRPEQAARVFRGSSLYTGDLGKRDADGYLYFLGRKDMLLKSMGFRVSPEEIEEALLKLEGVKEVAVTRDIAQDQPDGIKALVVCEEGISLDSDAVLRYSRRHLPHYMIPRRVEFVRELPRTANFKISRSQL